MKQFEECFNEDFVVSGALMPDAHLGYVAPIGSVLVTRDYVVPSWVGYDIGCGMIACKFKSSDLLSQVKENSKMIFDEVNRAIPMGKGRFNDIENISSKTKDEFEKILSRFKEKEYDKNVLNYIQVKAHYHLGTLGSGNHFIEIGFDEKNKNSDEVWLIIHSGSRGVGHTLATKYMKKAAFRYKNGGKGKKGKFEDTYPLEMDSRDGKEYLNILEFGLDFALLNRLEMAYKVRDVLRGVLSEKDLDFELWTNKNHNHAVMESLSLIDSENEDNDDEVVFVHRKGATPAKKGEKGVIPGNMKDGSFLVEGLGSKEF